MLKGRFIGRILPSFLGFTFTDITPITVRSSTGKWPTVKFSIQIMNCSIDIDCELSRYEEDDLGYLHVRALDLTRACVDLAVFGSGQGMTVILDAFTKPNGQTVLLAFTQRELASECTAITVTPTPTQEEREKFAKLMTTVTTDPALFLALHDLAQTVAGPHQVPTNCGRVLDGLRKIVAADVDAKKGWVKMQQLLNVSPEYMKWVSDQSANPRHGDRSFVPGPVIKEISRRTWAVMNRFLEFRIRGSQPLPISEFPMLNPP
jgi:hypothetical protein